MPKPAENRFRYRSINIESSALSLLTVMSSWTGNFPPDNSARRDITARLLTSVHWFQAILKPLSVHSQAFPQLPIPQSRSSSIVTLKQQCLSLSIRTSTPLGNALWASSSSPNKKQASHNSLKPNQVHRSQKHLVVAMFQLQTILDFGSDDFASTGSTKPQPSILMPNPQPIDPVRLLS